MYIHHVLVYTIIFVACIINVSSFTIKQESLIEHQNVKRVKRADDLYTTEYDNFDIDGVLQSDRLMKSYIKCILDKGPCTKEGRILKEYIPDALQSDCIKCSDVQKRQGGKVLSIVLQEYRDDWNLIVEKYDPEGIFRKKYGYDENDENNGDDDEGDEA